MGAGAAGACLDILGQCEGDKFIAMATYPMLSPPPESFVMLKTIYSFVSWNIAWFFRSKIRGVRSKFIFGTTLAFNGVGDGL
jgi:hypothetical protein